MSKNAVKLYIYEISRGLARQMSPLLLGKQIDGIWHTGIVVFGREYFFGTGGIEYCFPGGTILAEPDEIIDLGETQVTRELFEEYLGSLGSERFRPEMYHLFEHNCNTFSNEIAQFLTGRKIPKHIQDLPNDVMNTAFGAMIKPLVDSMSVRPAGGTSVNEPSSSTAYSAAAGPENIFEPRVKQQGNGNSDCKQRGKQNATAANYCERPKAALFYETDLASILSQIKDELEKDNVEKQDFQQLQELESALLHKELVLQNENIKILGKIIDKSIAEHQNLLLPALQVLKVAASSKSFVTSSDGGEVIQRVADQYTESLPKDIQLNILYTLCNACSSPEGHRTLTRNRISSKLISLVVSGLLSDETDTREAAAALVYNVALEKVKDDIALECATAIIEFLSRNSATTSSESGFRCLFALKNFMESSEEVKRLAVVMEVDVGGFRGKTTDIDLVCSQLERMLK